MREEMESAPPAFEVVISGRNMPDTEAKAKARKKAQYVSDKPVIITPAIPLEDRQKGKRRKLRIAAYCRVSTPTEAQVSSIENQKSHFIKAVAQHEDWVLVAVFADEGISGTNRKKRKSFNEMIERCKEGKIDRILIKDVARFSRNIVDSLTVARELRELTPPVAIEFETLGFDTLKPDYEVLLSIMTTCCQLESQQKSESMLWSIKERYEKGNFLCPTNNLLGYITVDDRMVIEEEGAKTVRLIYYMYLAGYPLQEIADIMTNAKRRTGWLRRDAEGHDIYNTHWSQSSVLNILRNERYCGDIKAQKTITTSYLTHNKRPNHGERPSYWQDDHHDGIVSKEVYALAQQMIAAKRYGVRNAQACLSLSIIMTGLLKGFIPMNRVWAGVDMDELISLADTVSWKQEPSRSIEVSPICQFEVMRIEYTENQDPICLTFSGKHIVPNAKCCKSMAGTEYVEFLIQPTEKLLAIRAAASSNENAVRWADWSSGACKLQTINAGAISSLVYDVMNWNQDWKFKANGVRRTKNGETVLIFDLTDTSAFIPIMQADISGEDHFLGWNQPIFPYEWRGQVVGPPLVNTLTKCRMHMCDYFGEWDVQAEAVKPKEYSRKVPLTRNEILSEIAALSPETL